MANFAQFIISALLFASLGITSSPRLQAEDANFAASHSRVAPFDPEKKVYQNQILGDTYQDMEFWPFLKAYLFGPEIRTPSQSLPTVKPDWKSFLAEDGEALKWIWFGHSGLYLNIKGTRILIDVVFSSSAAPIPFLVSRFQAPISTYEELPIPDVILISHDHYDHLDKDLIKYFAKSPVKFIAPLGVGEILRDFGVESRNIQELDWYEQTQVGELIFSAAPAQHFSGRGLFDRNKTLWASWIIKQDKLQIYYSGDSGYAPHFKEIRDRFGAFDLAFIDSGQYSSNWRYVHLLPNEVIQAAQDLAAKAIAPVHWGLFNLAMHDWFEPVEEITRLAKEAKLPVWHTKQGELNRLSSTPPEEAWWREHPDFISRQSSRKLLSPSP